jgi:hypothetical protein
MVGKTSETGEVRLGLMLYAPQQSSCQTTITCTKPRYEILRRDVVLSRKAPDGRSDGGDGQHRHYLSIKMVPKEIKVNLKVVVMEGGADNVGCKVCAETDGMDTMDNDAAESHPEMQGTLITVSSSEGGDAIVQGTAGTNGVASLPLFVLDPTKLMVQAQKPGYRVLSTVVPISDKDDKQTIEVALEMMRTAVVAPVCVKVQSIEDGTVLHGAVVTIVDRKTKQPVALGCTDREVRGKITHVWVSVHGCVLCSLYCSVLALFPYTPPAMLHVVHTTPHHTTPLPSRACSERSSGA